MEGRLPGLIAGAETARFIDCSTCDDTLRWWSGFWLRVRTWERHVLLGVDTLKCQLVAQQLGNPEIDSKAAWEQSYEAYLQAVSSAAPWLAEQVRQAGSMERLQALHYLNRAPELLGIPEAVNG